MTYGSIKMPEDVNHQIFLMSMNVIIQNFVDILAKYLHMGSRALQNMLAEEHHIEFQPNSFL